MYVYVCIHVCACVVVICVCMCELVRCTYINVCVDAECRVYVYDYATAVTGLWQLHTCACTVHIPDMVVLGLAGNWVYNMCVCSRPL